MKRPTVYILASEYYGTLYIGVTSDLIKRMYQHKNKLIEGFSKQYNVDQLVYYEVGDGMAAAIAREKQLKRWMRRWKIELIESVNPDWRDLTSEITGENA